MSEANKTKNTAEATDENAGKVPNESAGKSPDKIQWHAGFCSAMQLELKAQWPVLDFSREYSLTKKALAVDLLVVRKEKDAIIENEVGRFFRGHNLLEYKSPDDEMGIDTYYKLLAYSVLNVVIHANWEQIQKIIEEGDKTMFDCPALNELFAPKIRESNMKVYLEAMKEVSDFETAKKRFQVKFHLNSQQAEEKMKLYW